MEKIHSIVTFIKFTLYSPYFFKFESLEGCIITEHLNIKRMIN